MVLELRPSATLELMKPAIAWPRTSDPVHGKTSEDERLRPLESAGYEKNRDPTDHGSS
jgi:hypothetical protein